MGEAGLIRARRTYQLRKLLVIDDDERTVVYYRELLTPHGFEVLIAHDGEQAIPLVENNPDIQLVILDLSMPRMDGRQWLRWFRARRQDSPVVIVTGFKSEAEDAELQASVVLEKPVDVAELLDVVGLFCGLGAPISEAT